MVLQTKIRYDRFNESHKFKPNYEDILRGLGLIFSRKIRERRGLTINLPNDLVYFDMRNKRIEELILNIYNHESKNWRDSTYRVEESENESINLKLKWENYGLRYNVMDLRRINKFLVRRSIDLLKTTSENTIAIGKLQQVYETNNGLVAMEFFTLDSYLETFV